MYDPEQYSAITNNCKPPHNVLFPETELSFRFVRFVKFVSSVCYCRYEHESYCLSSVLFSHKNVVSFDKRS